MKPELNLLVWSVVLTVVQMLVAAQAAFNKVGLMTLWWRWLRARRTT